MVLTSTSEDPPSELAVGEEVFQANCAACHGEQLEGSLVGPSFLDDIYAPEHHPDDAIRAAVANGVQPHHWDFGAMPPVPGLSDADVEAVIAYVRHEQEDNGVGVDGASP